MARRSKGQAVVEKKAQALSTLTIEYVPTAAIRPNTYNPNRQNDHEFTLLCKSIEEDGFTQPIIVGADDVIVDGEHRWRAAQHLGLDPIPIVRVPMEGAQARIATLRHNRARGTEDVELSVSVLRDLEALGALDWAADSLDLSDAELERLLSDIPVPEQLAGEEFTDAWAPSAETGSVATPDAASNATPAALDRAREQEKAIAAAKSEEEKQAIARDNQVYRVSLIFTNDEAVVVKLVLGDQPAAALLALCRAQVEPAVTSA